MTARRENPADLDQLDDPLDGLPPFAFRLAMLAVAVLAIVLVLAVMVALR